MSKVFAVIVQTVPGYRAYSDAHPEHQQHQGAWFQQAATDGKLLACGPFLPHDGTGLWLLRAESLEEAQAIARTSPRYTEGMLDLEKTRIVEWGVSIGKDRIG